MHEAPAIKRTNAQAREHHPIGMKPRHVDLRKRHRTAVDGGVAVSEPSITGLP
jgi:hypothetical protein